MTRPHCTWSSRPGPLLRYAAGLRPGDQPGKLLGGTILWEGPAQTVCRLKALPVTLPAGLDEPWMHLTLSLPPLVELDQEGWIEALRLLLDTMGFPAKAIPWIAFQHPPTAETNVSHAHVLGLPMTHSGRWLECSNREARCDRAAAALLHHLAIPAAPRPPLALNLPKRRQTTPAHRHIATALDDVFQRVQPTGPEGLSTALWDSAKVTVTVSPNSHGTRSYAFSYEGAPGIRGKTLSNDLVPSAIDARFALNDKLRQARTTLDLRQLLRALSAHAEPLSNLFEEISHAERHHPQQPDAPGRNSDAAAQDDRAVDQDRRDHQLDPSDGSGVATASGAAGAAGGRGNGAWPESGTSSEPHAGAAGGDRAQSVASHDVAEGIRRPTGGDHDDAEGARQPALATGGGTGEDPRVSGNDRRAGPGDAADGGRTGTDKVRPQPVFCRPVPRGRLAWAMIRAQALARRLGLSVRIRLSRKTRSLHLRFADASALWLSRSGAGLAAPAKADSDAHRFAKAHAQNVSWENLVDRQNWPVPRPCHPGDWLSAPAANLPALRVQILRAATVAPLTGSTLEPGQVLALLPQHERVPMPKFAPPGARHRFALLSEACLASTAQELALQIVHLDALAEQDPALIVLWFVPERNALTALPQARLADTLRNRLERMLERQTLEPPSEEPDTLSDDGAAAEIGVSDDDFGIR